MPRPTDLHSSEWTYTYQSAFAAATAIKTSIATATAAQSYSGAALNGSTYTSTVPPANGGTGTGVRIPFGQKVTVTTTSSANSYNIATPITVTGYYLDHLGSERLHTDTITLTATGGGETRSTTRGFCRVTQIDVPAMGNTSGAFTFGVGDIQHVGANGMSAIRSLRAGAAGNVTVVYANGITDTIPLAAGESIDVQAVGIIGATTTAWPITLKA